ncbi:MAG: type II toxin-antitoxin system Phd/YefM family antitoxin [Rhodanobacteraceae bacterium]
MRAINYSEARNRLAGVLDDVVNDVEPTIITRRGDSSGERAVVMLPLASYNSMMDTAYVLRGGNRDRLVRSLAELKAGRARRHALVKDRRT